jgi:hypothetical protein
MNRKTGIAAAVVLLLWTAGAWGQAASDFNVELTKDGKGVIITGYTGKVPVVRIPAAIEGVPVREIGAGAFQGLGLTALTLPPGITRIGESAFRDNQLTSVTLPAELVTLGRGAFYENKLTAITIPPKVTLVEDNPVCDDTIFIGTNITIIIGANVTVTGGSTMSFAEFYNYENGRKAGRYTFTFMSQEWTYRAR